MECPNCHIDNPSDSSFCGKCGTKLTPLEETSPPKTETFETPLKEITRGSTLSGRYEIIEELGKGGMGRVYRVVDKKINEEVALKLLAPEIASSKKTIERFKNELKFARKISHKNVCRMYDFNEEEETPYITMEYVPGEDLKSVVRMTGQLSVGRAISIAKQICQGLAEAHQLGIIHRDLKSSNIMIDKRGNVRIMDFGVARSLEAKGTTGAKIMIGTPEYMSPEQVEGKEADQRSDIYSLGIILYEMLSGRLPFEGDTSLSIALKHKTDIPPNPRKFNAQLPEKFSQMILRCLEKDKEKRYQTAEELLSELSRIEKEVPAKPGVLIERKPTTEVLKKRFQSILLPAILLAALAAVGYIFIRRPLQTGEMRWKNSIAVLPFQDFSLQKDQEHLCSGMAEAVVARLSQIKELKVVHSPEMIGGKDLMKDPKKIGRDLKVKNILEGRILKEGNRIRISVELRDVETNAILWESPYDKDLQNIFEIQDEISLDIAKKLKIELLPADLDIMKPGEPKNIEAYEYYEWGRYYIEKKYFNSKNKEDFNAGLKMYEKALELEPNYALAYWGLGNAYECRYNVEKDIKDLDEMLKNYKKAYGINPNSAQANLGLGWYYFYLTDNDKAFQFFKKAFELDSKNVSINYDIGSFLRSIGLYSQATKFYSRAIVFDPLNIEAHRLLAICYMHSGEFERADNYFKRALDIFPDNVLILTRYANLLIFIKNYEEADKRLKRAEQMEPDNQGIQLCRALLFAARGKKEKALQLSEGAKSYHPIMTSIYSLLAMKDEAINNINKGIEEGFKNMREYLYSYPFLKSNPCYDNLRDDPRFKEIVKRENKRYIENLKKYGRL
jgi:serine/threonine protein kinase